MKERSDWWTATAGLAVLAVVAVGLGLLFRGQRPTPGATEPTATVTTTCTPAPTTTPVSAATPTPAPTGTPPPRHLSAAVEVQTPEGFWPMDLAGDVMVGSLIINGDYKIVTWDLVTGEVKPISSTRQFKTRYFARISESWVVWIEGFEAGEEQPDEMKLWVYDRKKQREFTLEAAAPSALDLSGDVVVWEEWREGENNFDVYAHNLRTGQRWAVTARSNGQLYPHISGQWVIYLDYAIPFDQPGSIALWAYNLESGEDRLVGQVYHPAMSSAGTYHALSGSRVVWTTPMGADYTFQVLSLDLDNPQDQPSVVMSPGDFAPESLHLFDDILVYHRGWGRTLYDLQRREQLAVLEQADTVIISDNRAVWEETLPAQDGSEKWSYRLYIATIEQ